MANGGTSRATCLANIFFFYSCIIHIFIIPMVGDMPRTPQLSSPTIDTHIDAAANKAILTHK